MKTLIKWTAILLLLIVILAIVTAYAPDTDKDKMIAKYGGEQAQFVQMTNGPMIHYRDQGERDAPALIMVHGMSGYRNITPGLWMDPRLEGRG